MEQTEAIKQQAEHAEEEVKKQLQEAGKEGVEIVARATRSGEEVRQKAQQAAQKDAEALLGRARAEIQRERDEAIGDLRKEFADLTVTAAGKVIDRSLDKEAHRQLINQVLEKSKALKKG
jgi:F-type H+-transporting ATPase subunit b